MRQEIRSAGHSLWDLTRSATGLARAAAVYVPVAALGRAIDVAAELGTSARERAEDAASEAGSLAERARGRLEGMARDATREVQSARRKAGREVQSARRRAERELGVADLRGVPYEERTLEQLQELASEREVAGRSAMNKAELIAALRSA